MPVRFRIPVRASYGTPVLELLTAAPRRAEDGHPVPLLRLRRAQESR